MPSDPFQATQTATALVLSQHWPRVGTHGQQLNRQFEPFLWVYWEIVKISKWFRTPTKTLRLVLRDSLAILTMPIWRPPQFQQIALL